MDIGTPSRKIDVSQLEEILPKPLLDEKREKCSLCCALKTSGVVFGVLTFVFSPFNALAHGIRAPSAAGASSSASTPLRHPLSRTDYSAATAVSSKFLVSDGAAGSIYAQLYKDPKSPNASNAAASPLLKKSPVAPSLSQRRGSGFTRNVGFVADRYLFHSLPLAGIVFTHQLMMSESMWSKNEKPLYTINFQTLAANTLLWIGGAYLGRVILRKLIIPRSRAASLIQFEYDRGRRVRSGVIRPTLKGQLSHHVDVRHIVFLLAVYSLVWSTCAMVNEHLSNNHYSMFHGMLPSYSRSCAPRWREWRENEIRKSKLLNQHGKVVQEMGTLPSDAMWGGKKTDRTARVL